MLRHSGTYVWQNETVRDRLSWYRAVMQNWMPAKFLICKRVPCEIDLTSSSEDELWLEHRRLAGMFRRFHHEVSSSKAALDDYPVPERTFLDLKVAILNRMLLHCNFCEWNCMVDRIQGVKRGACRMDATTRVAAHFSHFGEEAPLVGTGGSGTIFFAGCVFRCVFCQNWDISQYPLNGTAVDGSKLATMMQELKDAGVHNINFVGGEPTPNLHTILDGMRYLESSVAMLWNSDMYASLPAMQILVDVIDIWLPDFKYGNDGCALRLSKVMRYFPVVARNHLLAAANGDMIIRHLVLPNHLECCTKPVLSWIASNCPRALVNVMGQYRPDYLVSFEPERHRELARTPTRAEMTDAYRCARELGIIFEPVS